MRILCSLGFHNQIYKAYGKLRKCTDCKAVEVQNGAGEWVKSKTVDAKEFDKIK